MVICMDGKYKRELIKGLHEYIDISATELCKNCEKCCEGNCCELSLVSYGLANIFGIKFFVEERDEKKSN